MTDEMVYGLFAAGVLMGGASRSLPASKLASLAAAAIPYLGFGLMAAFC